MKKVISLILVYVLILNTNLLAFAAEADGPVLVNEEMDWTASLGEDVEIVMEEEPNPSIDQAEPDLSANEAPGEEEVAPPSIEEEPKEGAVIEENPKENPENEIPENEIPEESPAAKEILSENEACQPEEPEAETPAIEEPEQKESVSDDLWKRRRPTTSWPPGKEPSREAAARR